MSHTIERYQSVIFPVPKWTKWWCHKWVWSFPNHYILKFCLETITSIWYPPSIIKTRKITKWGKKNYKVGQLFPITKLGKIITEWGSSKITKWGKKLQSGVGITKWGKKITKWGRYYKVGQNYKVGHNKFFKFNKSQFFHEKQHNIIKVLTYFVSFF